MNISLLIITILGLALFEIISSIDNAIVNADVLVTMRPKARKWFLLWGLLFAVFVAYDTQMLKRKAKKPYDYVDASLGLFLDINQIGDIDDFLDLSEVVPQEGIVGNRISPSKSLLWCKDRKAPSPWSLPEFSNFK